MPELPQMLALRDPIGTIGFKFLPFDTSAFGVSSYGFDGFVTQENAVVGLEQCPTPIFLSMKVEDGNMPAWRDFLVRHKFAFIDTELHLTGRILPHVSSDVPTTGVEFSEELNLVECLSPELFSDLPSRFSRDAHMDGRLVVKFWNRYLADMVEQKKYRAIFPLVKGRPVGVCLLAPHDERLVIQLIALEPAFRRQGIASRILAYGVEKTGMTTGSTEVYAGGGAVNYYLRNGLTRVEKVSHVFHSWLRGQTPSKENKHASY